MSDKEFKAMWDDTRCVHPTAEGASKIIDILYPKIQSNQEVDISSDKEMGQGNVKNHLTNDVYFVWASTNDCRIGKPPKKQNNLRGIFNYMLAVKKANPECLVLCEAVKYYGWLPRKKKKQFKKLMNL